VKALVTGATGFIGGHLCQRLVREGHAVVALVRSAKRAAGLPAQVERLEGDLAMFERAELELPACDVVIHLAGVVAAKNAREYDRVNFRGVRALLDALQRQRWRPRRLLFASSLAAAGCSAAGVRLTERDECQPLDDYGRAKRAAELLVQEAPFPTTAFRPAVVFGPRDPATLTFFKMAARGWGFRVAGAPQKVSFIDVDDLVAAIVAMAGDVSTGHRTFFVGARQDLDSAQLWQTLAEVIGRRVRVLAVPRPALYVAHLMSTAFSKVFRFTNRLDRKQYQQLVAPAFLCSSEALERAYGWAPRVGFAESLRKALEGYRAEGWL
jgi:nucleoside-diphosphate-sugar epimerase